MADEKPGAGAPAAPAAPSEAASSSSAPPTASSSGGGAVAAAGSSTQIVDNSFFEPINAQIEETLEQFEMFSLRKPRNLMAGCACAAT